jgi:hypothetical protein
VHGTDAAAVVNSDDQKLPSISGGVVTLSSAAGVSNSGGEKGRRDEKS